MKKSVKSALISALVFPGAGHLYLRRYVVGSLLTLISIITLYILVANAIDVALSVADKIESGGVPLDTSNISKLVSQQSQHTERSSNIATLLLCVAWIVGVVDSYRVGLAQERGNNKVA